MQTRHLNEAAIGLVALGKAVELGRQLVLVTNNRLARQKGADLPVKPQTLQVWSNGYIVFDAVISITGFLAMIQGMRKNRKGAGQAAIVQGTATTLYGLYYLLYSLVALKDAKGGQKLLNAIFSLAHAATGVIIVRFAKRALA